LLSDRERHKAERIKLQTMLGGGTGIVTIQGNESNQPYDLAKKVGQPLLDICSEVISEKMPEMKSCALSIAFLPRPRHTGLENEGNFNSYLAIVPYY
jgi:hypothetical protein